ncbi:C39 family peptidase [Pseudomonas alcaligenes]|uniref:Peptidase C39 n=1 Tax=Aquipseudomonas alcaligenes TaxID=43263 RepID=A0A2V4LCP5_AQUAC|nr:C39 family peptidase [Pseudomonas alcaligenes]PYC22550.1 peptidase C39 [Pseudomonas alcaligenes]
MLFRDLLLVCLALLPVATQAARLPIPGLAGGNFFTKEVESIQERRFRDLIRQRTDYSCGAAALATLLREAYRLDVDEMAVIEGMLEVADLQLVERQGFSMLDMKNYLQTEGFRAKGYRLQANMLASVKVPTIVLVEIRGFKHFVVMQKATDQWVYIGDPALGHRRLTLDEFTQGWNGIVFAVIGPGYDRHNSLLSPPQPLTARDRVNGFNPIQDSELIEFGFSHSDFF